MTAAERMLEAQQRLLHNLCHYAKLTTDDRESHLELDRSYDAVAQATAEVRAEMRPAPEEPDDGATIEDGDALAIVMYLLFGGNATLDIEDGGYIRWEEGKMSAGILQQVDERLTRLEEEAGLPPLEFMVRKPEGDDDE